MDCVASWWDLNLFLELNPIKGILFQVKIRVCNLPFISKLLPNIPKQQFDAKLKHKLKLRYPIMNYVIQKEGHQKVSFVIQKKR